MLAFLRILVRVAEFTDRWVQGKVPLELTAKVCLTKYGRFKTRSRAAAEPTSLSTDLQPLNPLIPAWDLLVKIRDTMQILPRVELVKRILVLTTVH